MKSATSYAVGALALCSMMLIASPASAGKNSDVTVVNHSDWEIHYFYLSPVDDESWGPDQLSKHVIGPDEEFTLTHIPCDVYDVKLVDEDGDECVVPEVELCADSDEWVITNDDLLDCEGY